jgi:hypothetical protein
MAGMLTIGFFAFAFLLLFYHDAEWIPESMKPILKTLGIWMWGLILVGMVIGAILTPPWARYS